MTEENEIIDRLAGERDELRAEVAELRDTVERLEAERDAANKQSEIQSESLRATTAEVERLRYFRLHLAQARRGLRHAISMRALALAFGTIWLLCLAMVLGWVWGRALPAPVESGQVERLRPPTLYNPLQTR